jgi:hypothetical protein
MCAGWAFVQAFYLIFQLGSDYDQEFTAWVGRPSAAAFGVVFLVSLLATMLLCLKRWRLPTRKAIFWALIAVTVTLTALGLQESLARRYVAHDLVAAANAIPAPPDMTAQGVTELSYYGGSAFYGLYSSPEVRRTLVPHPGTPAQACADVNLMVAKQPGWQPWGSSCSFERPEGRIRVFVEERDPGTIVVTADPNDW